jgi:hypothetical protein
VTAAHRTALLARARLPGWVPDVLAAVLAAGLARTLRSEIKSG